MASAGGHLSGELARAGGLAPHRWPVWRLPARLLGIVLLVEALAAALLVAGFRNGPAPTAGEVGAAVALCALGIAYAEMSLDAERERRRLSGGSHVDLSSVWTFAAALILPPATAAVVATVVLMHLWVRAWRASVPLHRQLFTVATVVLACFATRAVLGFADPGGGPAEHPLWVLLLALVGYTTVNAGLVAVAVAAESAGPVAVPALLGRWDEHALEIGMLCMGALTAVALTLNPWLVLLALPPLFVVLRAVLVRPLEAAASTDGKTGLLNAAAWLAQAERVLTRPAAGERATGVLVLDLDHFKSVNDTHGHVVGDRVLAAVADVLRRAVRGPDLVGRLGGEEFVVLPRRPAYGSRSVELEAVELEVVAERIRARVADLRVPVPTAQDAFTVGDLSVSIGGAVPPASGSDLASLLQTADAALYAAKRAGRNTVRIEVAPPGEPPAAAG